MASTPLAKVGTVWCCPVTIRSAKIKAHLNPIDGSWRSLSYTLVVNAGLEPATSPLSGERSEPTELIDLKRDHIL